MQDRVDRALREYLRKVADDIMEAAKRRRPPVFLVGEGDGTMCRVRGGRLERFDDLLGWVDVAKVGQPRG